MKDVNSQERLLVIVELLAKKGLEGMSNKELVVELSASAPQVCRDVAILKKRGWVQQLQTGAYRLAPFFGNFANQLAQHFRQARLDLAAEEESYFSIPR